MLTNLQTEILEEIIVAAKSKIKDLEVKREPLEFGSPVLADLVSHQVDLQGFIYNAEKLLKPQPLNANGIRVTEERICNQCKYLIIEPDLFGVMCRCESQVVILEPERSSCAQFTPAPPIEEDTPEPEPEFEFEMACGQIKECCHNCHHFENFEAAPDAKVTGHCEWSGDDIECNPTEITCFDYQVKELE